MFGARCDPPTPGAQGSGARTCAAPPLTVPALVQASPGPVLRGTRGSRAWTENGLRFCQPPTAVRSFPQRRRAAGGPGGVGGAPVTGRPRASSQRTLAAVLGHRVTALMRRRPLRLPLGPATGRVRPPRASPALRPRTASRLCFAVTRGVRPSVSGGAARAPGETEAQAEVGGPSRCAVSWGVGV